MKCPKCGHELSDRATMCPYCGADWATREDKDEITDTHRRCTYCGKEIPPVAKFCPGCGHSVVSNLTVPSETGSKAEEIPLDNFNNTGRNVANDLSPRSKRGQKKRGLYCLLGGFAAVCLIAIIYILFIFNPFNPARLKETGTYELRIGDTIELQSIDASVQFVDFIVNVPDYSDITVDVQYIFVVTLPNSRSCEACFQWLNDFDVNGNPVDYQVGIYSLGEFRPISPELLETETMAFAVTYRSSYSDNAYVLTCPAGEDLDIKFLSNQSFWDLIGIDRSNAEEEYQERLDLQSGIRTYDVTENDESDFEIGNWYRLTGRVLYSGKYMGDLTDDYQICFSMADTSWFPQYYCYFSEAEWNRLPDLSSGDIVTLYGRYDYTAIVGYNFHDCTIESPAGTFVLNSNGIAEVIP